MQPLSILSPNSWFIIHPRNFLRNKGRDDKGMTGRMGGEGGKARGRRAGRVRGRESRKSRPTIQLGLQILTIIFAGKY